MEATLEISPVAGALGAVVRGLDLRRVGDAGQLQPLIRALAEHLVVFLPEQDLDLDDLERVTDLLGGRDVTPFVAPLPDRPYVIRVVKEPGDRLNFANAWHTDLSYLPSPPAFTLLHAREVPEYGGDTVWSNQYLAFETLSAGLRRTLHQLRAVHSAGMAYGTGGALDKVRDLTSMAIEPSPDAYREHTHPVVVRHPLTGRPTLYVNPVYTTRFEGWTPGESQALLDVLHRHSTNENFTCRFRWSAGTLGIWDNRCTMHNALNDYSGVRREMFRTSVRGVPLEAA
ncbi:MAG TPA: TauD/TfdA family dioxygenase [Acidimicrobiales bacterium]|nr:TauD/TfdA family dioxygenase [Acidimicrobiales bacterium]